MAIIRITDQYLWNVVFLVFFIALVVMGVIILDTEATLSFVELGALDLVLITLASARVIRLFVYDSITKFIREQFYDAKVTKAGKVTLYKPARGPRRTIVDLISCPWCFGIFASAVVLFFYMLSPMAYFPVLILAIASVATWLQLLSNILTSKTE